MRLGVRVPSFGPPERGGLAESRTQTRSMGLKKAHTWPCSSVGRAPPKIMAEEMVRFRSRPKTKPLAGSPNGHRRQCAAPCYWPPRECGPVTWRHSPKATGMAVERHYAGSRPLPAKYDRLVRTRARRWFMRQQPRKRVKKNEAMLQFCL